ncbi:HtaA domain-containing protein [Leucobacter japonicus]|uniref:HtaA domain-containing protein n=1 Tax=Leucobacter japonicus TaxID=1461259 RepID=UPI0006A77C06|nr:HtaA domain-containing protein [Leucobacter japonicus]
MSLRSRLRVALAIIATGTIGLTGVSAVSSVASADDSTVAPLASGVVISDGGLNWGVKESFRSYLTGPIAHGSISASGGATFDGSNFHWNAGSGVISDALDTAQIQFPAEASIHFLGHGGALDVTLSHLAIQIESPTKAVLVADAAGVALSGEAYDLHAMRVATMTLNQPVIASGTATWSAAPTVLAPEGVPVFANFYTAGTAMDPVTFSVRVPVAATSTQLSASPVTSTVGTAVTARATVLPAGASGTVQFTEQGKPVGTPVVVTNGIATKSLSFSTAGARTLGAVFVPSNSLSVAGSSAQASASANAKTTTTIKLSPSTVAYNGAETITVGVKPSASGAVATGIATVTVAGKRYSASVQNGAAVFRVNAPVSVGAQTVTASFAPATGSYALASAASAQLKVTKVTPSVTAKFAKPSVTTKQAAQVTVGVKVPGVLKAQASKLRVEVYDGSKKIATSTLSSAGTAAVNLPKLSAGSHKVKVKFVGSANLNAAYSAVATLTVKK